MIYRYDTQLFSSSHPKEIWVEATLHKSQVATYKNLGIFCRVPFKSLLKVQIKRVTMVFAKLESLGNCRKANIDPKSHIETQLDSLAPYIHIGITFLIVDEPQRGKKLVTCRVRTLIPQRE